MPLHPNTQKVLRLLKFFDESGWSCTEDKLQTSEFWGLGWDIILEQECIAPGFVDRTGINTPEERYTLNQKGKQYLDDQSPFDD
ncbi:MAG: hypothetical protein IH977_17060 [Nitrospinae bacterium]|nr:hypothetical protein [Nitrospinota bacterium]